MATSVPPEMCTRSPIFRWPEIIAAPHDGTVAELLYAPGDQVTEGVELLRLERKA